MLGNFVTFLLAFNENSQNATSKIPSNIFYRQNYYAVNVRLMYHGILRVLHIYLKYFCEYVYDL